MITVELFLEDLSEKGKKKFVEAGIDPYNSNWDVIPFAILEFEQVEEVE